MLVEASVAMGQRTAAAEKLQDDLKQELQNKSVEIRAMPQRSYNVLYVCRRLKLRL